MNRVFESDVVSRINPEQSFLNGLSDVDMRNASLLESQIAGSHPDGRPIERFTFVIPVGLHQEKDNIYHAVHQFTGQKIDETSKFSVVLGLNHPESGVSYEDVEASKREVVRAQDDFTELDIRPVEMVYRKPTIGRIRRDLFNACVLNLAINGRLSYDARDTFLVNQDIDLIAMSPNYVQDIADHYDSDSWVAPSKYSLAPIAATPGVWQESPRHPRISRILAFESGVHMLSGSFFEAGVVFPARTYVHLGGINSKKNTGEVLSTVMSPKGSWVHQLSNSTFETSNRRHLRYLAEKGVDVWDDQTFKIDDPVRTKGQKIPDLTRKRFRELADDVYVTGVHCITKFVMTRVVDWAKHSAEDELKARGMTQDELILHEGMKGLKSRYSELQYLVHQYLRGRKHIKHVDNLTTEKSIKKTVNLWAQLLELYG